MPNNTLLMIGIGLAAFTLFRREETDVGEEDLVNNSMLASGTGDTGKVLGSIPTISADIPIGGPPPQAQAATDPLAWLQGLFAGLAPGVVTPKDTVVVTSNSDTQLPNELTGPAPEVNVTPFVQTPVYIRSTGERAGEALRQLGIFADPNEIDLLNPRINLQHITMAPEYGIGPLTVDDLSEDVQIVAGGLNPGDPYYTKLDVLAAYRDLGGFGPMDDYGYNTQSVIQQPEIKVVATGADLSGVDQVRVNLLRAGGYDAGMDWV